MASLFVTFKYLHEFREKLLPEVKPGSHMPPTYLGHGRRHGLGQRCGICEHLSPTHNLSQALIAGELSSTLQASRWSMPVTDYDSAINVHIWALVSRAVPAWGSAAYENLKVGLESNSGRFVPEKLEKSKNLRGLVQLFRPASPTPTFFSIWVSGYNRGQIVLEIYGHDAPKT